MSNQVPDTQGNSSRERARANAEKAVANLRNTIDIVTRPEPFYDWSDPDALAANKLGAITPDQTRMLKSAKSGKSLAGCLFWMLGLVVALPSLVGGLIERQSSLVGSGVALVAIFGLIWLIAARAAKQIDDDVAAKNITSAPGEVLWRRNRYIAITSGRQLKIADKSYGAPLPGPHDMYYLGKTGYLLAAAPLLVTPQATLDPTLSPDPQAILSSSEPARLALLHAVTAANGFRPRALVKNRAGSMTVGQRWRLFRSLQWRGVTFLAQMILALALIITPFFAGTNHANLSTFARVALMGGGVALLVYTLIWTSRSLFWHSIDVLRGELAVKEAKVTLDMHVSQGENDPARYYYLADDLRFSVSSNAYDALIPNIRYRLCYTPKTKILMNIEPLEALVSPTRAGG